VNIAEEWVVEAQYTVSKGWEIVWHCENEEDANEILNDYRTAEPNTPLRRRRLTA